MSDRKTVYDPPDEVVVIGYVWSDGNASGGRREAFLSMAEAERRLAHLLTEGKVKNPDDVEVHRLGEATWEPVAVHLPEPLRLAGNP